MPTSKEKTTRGGGEAIPARPVWEARVRPTHPGTIFREDYRMAQEPPVSQSEAAERLGWTRVRLNEFELGKRDVTAPNAFSLAALTGTSPEFWMQLQANVDLWDAYQKVKHIKRILPGEPFPVVKH